MIDFLQAWLLTEQGALWQTEHPLPEECGRKRTRRKSTPRSSPVPSPGLNGRAVTKTCVQDDAKTAAIWASASASVKPGSPGRAAGAAHGVASSTTSAASVPTTTTTTSTTTTPPDAG